MKFDYRVEKSAFEVFRDTLESNSSLKSRFNYFHDTEGKHEGELERLEEHVTGNGKAFEIP